MAGCKPAEIIDALKARGLWHGDARVAQRPAVSVHAHHGTVSHETRMRDRARALWERAGALAGTPAQHYLERRDIWSVVQQLDDVRFTMRCPREQTLQPAILVAMRHCVTRSLHAVQRIYLTQDRYGNVSKDGAMMLGPTSACAMQLMPIGYGQPWLHITEGFETGCAVIAMDRTPVWAVGSTSLMRSMPILDNVRQLYIWADHDPIDPKTGQRPGQAAAEALAKRWTEADRTVEILMPSTERWDAADVWSDRCARQ